MERTEIEKVDDIKKLIMNVLVGVSQNTYETGFCNDYIFGGKSSTFDFPEISIEKLDQWNQEKAEKIYKDWNNYFNKNQNEISPEFLQELGQYLTSEFIPKKENLKKN